MHVQLHRVHDYITDSSKIMIFSWLLGPEQLHCTQIIYPLKLLVVPVLAAITVKYTIMNATSTAAATDPMMIPAMFHHLAAVEAS